MLGRITATALLVVYGGGSRRGNDVGAVAALAVALALLAAALFALAAGVAAVGASVPDDDQASGLRLSDT